MKTILRFAIGAAIASALVHYLMRQRSLQTGATNEALPDEMPQDSPRAGGYTIEELAGEDREWGGGSSGLNS